MPAIISFVKENSIAQDLELKPGDEIISINNVKPIDLIDYQHMIAVEELDLHIKRTNGEEEIIEIEKYFEDDMGICFESGVFDKIKPCTNKCIFCFVDQQPPGLRNSLYIKDDDYRLSYLQGTYITLTNLQKKDKERIEKMMLGPLYISLHTTNNNLRRKMLGNPKAPDIMEELKWLNELDIPVHLQIVMCPGYNDGEELIKTLDDLVKLKSNILSVAIVPVGLTKYREGNELKKADKDKATETIDIINDFNEKVGNIVAHASDEFYILAGQDFPSYEQYHDFGQLEDGVGICRMLLNDFEQQKADLPKAIDTPKNFTMATGQDAYRSNKQVIDELNKIKNVNINLVPIESYFWGDSITVTGLITGQDLIDNLLPIKSEIDDLIISGVMLRKFTNDFLDNLTVEDVENKLECTIHVLEDYYSNDELIDLILD